MGRGSGTSKQASEQAAAAEALARADGSGRRMLSRLALRGFKSFADQTIARARARA